MSIPAAFMGIIIIWSTTPLAIQWSSEGGGFLFGVTARMALGLIFCLVAVRIAGVKMPWHAQARAAYLAAGVAIFGAMTLVYWAAQYIPSGWIAVLFGLVPLFTSVFSIFWLVDHQLERLELVGLSLGIVGLAVIFHDGASIDEGATMGVAAVVLAALLHAASSVWVKRLSGNVHALAVTCGGLMVAVPALVLVWFLFDGSWPQALPDRARYAIVYLALFGSVLGFFGYYFLLREVGAVRVNLVTLVTPVTALLLGHWLNGEVILSSVWLGTGFIVLGLAMHQWEMLNAKL
ncbi:Permease of the drug/metabolite transporter (DMT) superfamily [hydrothermal vent metagenome]|uniref:Permease of the drug/metabolite transporter (DMT) superfamily n=1 Tax=hydrothermal vent metagenome TaxID=652676 RepID=A0A3B0YKG1_9ZZZZ